jgi:ubiquinone/menaquinone biosynthesis C-methylase UbiE
MTTFVEHIQVRGYNVKVTTNDYSTRYFPDPQQQLDGMVRVSMDGLEYYKNDIDSWLPISGSQVDIEHSSVLDTVINWALIKMEEERKINDLADKYPALKQAKLNYETVKALVSNE